LVEASPVPKNNRKINRANHGKRPASAKHRKGRKKGMAL
jgi:hypothetical protein